MCQACYFWCNCNRNGNLKLYTPFHLSPYIGRCAIELIATLNPATRAFSTIHIRFGMRTCFNRNMKDFSIRFDSEIPSAFSIASVHLLRHRTLRSRLRYLPMFLPLPQNCHCVRLFHSTEALRHH